MSIWLVRAGSSGEYESKFLDDGRIYLTWYDLSINLKSLSTQEELRAHLFEQYPDSKKGRINNWSSQIWPIAHRMEIGDWVVLPSKKKASIHFAKITGEYEHHPDGPNPYFHSRKVEWFAQDIPRGHFEQDLLYSFGAFMTVCRITRNNAEARIRSMADSEWKYPKISATITSPEDDEEQSQAEFDIERLAKDQIARVIASRFTGHKLSELVDAILKAKGFLTYRAPPGPDKGVDLLAGAGALGFEGPKICVQVKSGDTPVDRPTLDQLIGAMQNVGAESGLLVSWSGFKGTVDKELPAQFFRVRLWDQDNLINEIFENYEQLEEEIRADLPLKRAWMLADQE